MNNRLTDIFAQITSSELFARIRYAYEAYKNYPPPPTIAPEPQVTSYQDPNKKTLVIACGDGGGSQGEIQVMLTQAFNRISGQPLPKICDQSHDISVANIIKACIWPRRNNEAPLLDLDELSRIFVFETHDKRSFWERWKDRDRTAAFSPKTLGKLFQVGHDIEGLEKLFNKVFGDLKLSDYKDGLYIHTVDLETKLPAIYSSDEAKTNRKKDFYIKHIVRAAISAPIQLKTVETPSLHIPLGHAHHYQLIDSAVLSNNPAYTAYRMNKAHYDNIIILNFGTGRCFGDHTHADDLNGGVAHRGAALFSTISETLYNRDIQYLLADMNERNQHGHQDYYFDFNIDLSGNDVETIMPHRMDEIIKWGAQAVRENRPLMKEAIETIYRLCPEKRPQNMPQQELDI